MRIKSVDSIPLSYATDDDPPTRRSFSILKITTDSGIVGWGEASDCYGHRHPLTVQALFEEDLQYALIGQSVRDPDDLVARLRSRVLASLGTRELVIEALSAIEIALRDLWLKATDQSAADWLGRNHSSIPIYAAGKPALSGDAMWHADFLRPVLDRGARAAKIRPGRGLEWDATFLTDMRRILGNELQLLVDGKYNYSLESAIELSHVVADIDGHCFEEPISDEDLSQVGRLARESPVPLAYGEHAYGEIGFRELIEVGGVGIVEPDVTVCGGMSEARRIADLAQRLGVGLIPHVGGLTAIGFAANVHLAASLDAAPLFEYDARPDQPLRDELALGAPFALEQVADGCLPVPDGPGLGVEIDEEVLSRYPYVVDEELMASFPTYGTPHL